MKCKVNYRASQNIDVTDPEDPRAKRPFGTRGPKQKGPKGPRRTPRGHPEETKGHPEDTQRIPRGPRGPKNKTIVSRQFNLNEERRLMKRGENSNMKIMK